MLLGTYYDGVELHREERIIYGRFLVPHRVISTCPAAGGIREDLEYLFNHQSCEPAGHDPASLRLAATDPEAYRSNVCRQHGLPGERCATLGTAANMRNASVKEARFRDLIVVAVCTGGAEANGGRAGDPASVYEHDGSYEPVSAGEPVMTGTINTMLFVSSEMTPAALVDAVMTATEAKAAALQELEIGSRYSDGLATGTGTDQVGVAARLGAGTPLTSAGKHTVLGELVGKTVHDAVREALKRQDSLGPENAQSCVRLLGRFGGSREHMTMFVAALLGTRKGTLFAANFTSVDKDPLVVAAVSALVHLRDMIAWGTLAEGCVAEIWAAYGAQVAAAVSGAYDRLPAYRSALGRRTAPSLRDLPDLVARAFALGFDDKWPEETEQKE